MVFRALIVLFSYGYNTEIYKIIEATFLTLHFFCPMRDFFASQRGAWPNGKYASGGSGVPIQEKITLYDNMEIVKCSKVAY